jgi:hypothetical protein
MIIHFLMPVYNLQFPSLIFQFIPSYMYVMWMRGAGHVARMEEKRNVYRLLVRKPEGTRPSGRPRRRWIDNIKMDHLEIGLSVVDRTGLAPDRYRSCEFSNEPSGSIKCWESTEWLHNLWQLE